MKDINLPGGLSQLVITITSVPTVLVGRIGQWHYRVACAQPTIHVEEGDWPDHTLDFDFDLFPSTFTINVYCHNDSSITALADLMIINTNGYISWQPSQKSIGPGSSRGLSFAAGLPRIRGLYYFDAVLRLDGVLVNEGRWTINYT